jgi:hypothetical protein
VRLAPLAVVFVAAVMLLPVSGSATSITGQRVGASGQLIAPLIRAAFALEKDAGHHRLSDPSTAKQELSAAAALLGQALALGPTGAVATDLRQALLKDQDAASLLGTPNEGKVTNDLAGALNRKQAALKALGQPLTGPFVPAKAVKPLPKPAKKATKPKPKRTSRLKVARLVEQAASDEVAAASALDSGSGFEAYKRLYAATILLVRALAAAASDPSLEKAVPSLKDVVVPDLRMALEDDVSLLKGTWQGSFDLALSNSIHAKAEALIGLGGTSISITPITATFDPTRLATVYSVQVVKDVLDPHPAPSYSWTLTLKKIDPDGSSPPGYQSTDPKAPKYASAAFDQTCNNKILPGGEEVGYGEQDAVYEWKDYGVNPFVWYHGDLGLYREAPAYGCDHTKMGARGHQGTVFVDVREGPWACQAGIEGSNLSTTPVQGSEPHCFTRNV